MKYGIALDIIFTDDSREIIIPNQNDARSWIFALKNDSSIKDVKIREATAEEYEANANFAKEVLEVFSKITLDEKLEKLSEAFQKENNNGN